MYDLFTGAYCFEGPNSILGINCGFPDLKVSDSLNFTNFLDLPMPQVKYVLL